MSFTRSKRTLNGKMFPILYKRFFMVEKLVTRLLWLKNWKVNDAVRTNMDKLFQSKPASLSGWTVTPTTKGSCTPHPRPNLIWNVKKQSPNTTCQMIVKQIDFPYPPRSTCEQISTWAVHHDCTGSCGLENAILQITSLVSTWFMKAPGTEIP